MEERYGKCVHLGVTLEKLMEKLDAEIKEREAEEEQDLERMNNKER